LRHRLNIGANPLFRSRPRVATVAQIEDKSRIPNGIPPKTGGGSFTSAQKFFDIPKQIHRSFPLKPHSDSAAH